MKRFLIVVALAAGALLISQNKASAWCSANFSTGLNTSFQSGGCKVLWGLFQSAPAPYPNSGNQCYPQCAPMMLPAEQKPMDPKPMNPKTGLDDAPVMPGATNQSMQQINYNYYPQYQGYTNPGYAAPSYWYER